eukprot:15472658-Alexandrium_andersonii.AAC.1
MATCSWAYPSNSGFISRPSWRGMSAAPKRALTLLGRQEIQRGIAAAATPQGCKAIGPSEQ